MKKYLLLIPLLFLISCEKDDMSPNVKELGFLGNY